MPVKWHEERIERWWFQEDPNNEPYKFPSPYIPLRSKWLIQSTGFWVHAWGVGSGGADTPLAFDMWKVDGFEGNNLVTSPGWYPAGVGTGIEQLDSTGETLMLQYGAVTDFGGRSTYSASRFCDLPNYGAAYAQLALQFNLVAGEESDPTPDPIWAAAKILYRVEH
jgi:hypothetical protein